MVTTTNGSPFPLDAGVNHQNHCIVWKLSKILFPLKTRDKRWWCTRRTFCHHLYKHLQEVSILTLRTFPEKYFRPVNSNAELSNRIDPGIYQITKKIEVKWTSFLRGQNMETWITKKKRQPVTACAYFWVVVVYCSKKGMWCIFLQRKFFF